MPRKAKDKIVENEIINEDLTAKKKTGVTKTSAKTRKSTLAQIIESIDLAEDNKKSDSKKKSKSSSVKNAKKSTAKKTSTAKESSKKDVSKKDDDKKTAAKKTTKKTSSVKKETTPKTTKKAVSPKKEATSKSPRKRTTKKQEKPSLQISEYYDLPYKYGNTVVKLLAQTPNTLFVYWEVSESDIENFKKLYGEDFFNKTTPILIVHNLTQNKKYEVEINDFANCWYLNTEDSDCKFDIELARRFTNNSNNEPDYLYIATSNNLQSPNDHILFEKIQEFVVFRNVNNDNVIKKNIKSFKFLKDIYKFYKDMYDEDVLNNPSSQFKF